MSTDPIVVVGAGVVGAGVTFHLACRGVPVLCVESAPEPGTGTTAVGFGTATAYRRIPVGYFRLNRSGIVEHARLAAAFGTAPWWHPTGTLAWSLDDGFRAYLDTLPRLDTPVRTWPSATAAAAELGPAAHFPAGATVGLLTDEGWIEGAELTRHLLAEAVRLGATVRYGTPVTWIESGPGRRVCAVRVGGERIAVTAVVNCAGSHADVIAGLSGTGHLLGTARRSLIVQLDGATAGLRHILRAPGVSLRPAAGDQVLVRSDQVDRGLPENGDQTVPAALLEELVRRAVFALPGLAGAAVRAADVVEARCPDDGLPSLGALSCRPGYYEAVSSAGVTLAPVFGRLLADLIVDGRADPLLTAFSPDRFRGAGVSVGNSGASAAAGTRGFSLVPSRAQ